MNIITFVSLKGGSGKTSATLNTGAALSRMGYKVLFVDLDSQNSLADTIASRTESGTLSAFIAGKDSAKTALIPCEYGYLLNRGTDPEEPADLYALKKALRRVSKQFDFVMIDTPPALSPTTVSAILAADGLIIPVLAQPYSLKSSSRLFVTLEELRNGEKIRADVYGILLNQYHGRQNLSAQTAEQFRKLAENNGTAIFETAIRETVNMPESQATHQSIFEYNNRATAAADYRAVTAEILERVHNKAGGKR